MQLSHAPSVVSSAARGHRLLVDSGSQQRLGVGTFEASTQNRIMFSLFRVKLFFHACCSYFVCFFYLFFCFFFVFFSILHNQFDQFFMQA